jgi:hypothetical protein
MIPIETALTDQRLLGAALGDPTTWKRWQAILGAGCARPLTDDQARLFAVVAGGRRPPPKRVREAWFIVGRRSGKSRIAAAISVYLAAFADYAERLAPGETGFVLVLAATRSQAKTILNYAEAFIRESPVLRQQLEEVTAEEIRLKGNIPIAVHSNNFRSVRGRTLIAAVFDETALWCDETSSMPDVETYRAILPALATVPGSMLVAISSPHAQRGLVYTKHRDHFGKSDNDVLVIQGASTQFNATLDAATIAAAQLNDPAAAQAEWEGKFRGDLSTFVDRGRGLR